MSTIYATPGESFWSELNSAPTGLVGTVGVRVIRLKDEFEVIPRRTTDIAETPAGTGHYIAQFVEPELGKDRYVVFWDAEGKTASDELVITGELPVPEELSYDVETDLGFVRLLISDIGGKDGKSFIFNDVEIETMLGRRENVYTAAASLLRVVAGNEAMVLKRIEFMELKTEGDAVSKELRQLATDLEKTSDEDALFEIAQMNVDYFSRRDIIMNRIRREGR